MVYMYCGPDPNQPNPGDPACNGRTAVALAHSSSITRLVVGSHRCRLPEFDAEAPEDWCDYEANFSSNIHRLHNAGIEILLNAAGAHKFASLPFVTGDAGVERMVELALALNASGWALDLEAKGITLASYQAFFRKIKAAFEPHGLKLQYTAGHHFQNSNNFSALLPLVDYCFDMTTYSKGGHAFPARFATVPPGLGTRYVPGSSVNQWVQSDTGPALHMFEAAAARGLTTIGLFTINDNVSNWWWPYLDAWIGSGGGLTSSSHGFRSGQV